MSIIDPFSTSLRIRPFVRLTTPLPATLFVGCTTFNLLTFNPSPLTTRPQTLFVFS